MPTLPFFEQPATGVPGHRQVADASDFTRFKRMASEAAPFLNRLPKLGWRSPSVATNVRFISSRFRVFRTNFPNAS